MSDHPNATIIREAADRLDREGDLTALAEYLADDVVWHEIGAEEPIRGKAALADRMAGYVGSGDGPRIRTETHDVVANDEHCVQLVTATATMGDQTFTYRTAEIYHMRDGKATHRWAFSDDTAAIAEFFS